MEPRGRNIQYISIQCESRSTEWIINGEQDEEAIHDLRVLERPQSMQRSSKFGVIQTSRRRRRWHPTPVLLPGKSHGQRSLVGCGPWGREESDMTERLPFHFSLSCIGAGNGNPLQCSCLENPRDRGAWWASFRLWGRTESDMTEVTQQLSTSKVRKIKQRLMAQAWWIQHSISVSHQYYCCYKQPQASIM